MATTVSSAFTTFASRLTPTDAQQNDASVKHTGIRDWLNETLWVKQAFLTGSYARHTLVRPPTDIDLFVVLDYAHHGAEYYEAIGGSQAILERFHSRLKAGYPDTPIRKDHPSVRLAFATVGFDVVPAFPRTGGGFVIPSHAGYGWLETDPTKHAARTSAMNKLTSNYFVPIVRMLKYWNYTHANKLTGFHLEMAAADAWPRLPSLTPPYSLPIDYKTYARSAAAILPALSTRFASTLKDPAGLSGAIDGYLSPSDRRLTCLRFSAAGADALIAQRHEARGDHAQAIAKWRGIFGDLFPTYG